MAKLEKRLEGQIKPGTRIVSHAFKFKNREPTSMVEVEDGKKTRRVYLYIW
jgi:hypothetical protein